MKKKHYIQQLIEQGEHQQLDFKFEISDSKKIARTLSAFSNTDGGRLLVGVKDNGIIAGVRSEEEFYMVEGAASLYSNPEIEFTTKEWNLDGKKVLEVIIERGINKPYKAPDREGNWKAFIRQNDQNLLANNVIIEVWKRQKSGRGTFVRYTEKEEILLKYLEDNQQISLAKFQKIATIPKFSAKDRKAFFKLKLKNIRICQVHTIITGKINNLASCGYVPTPLSSKYVCTIKIGFPFCNSTLIFESGHGKRNKLVPQVNILAYIPLNPINHKIINSAELAIIIMALIIFFCFICYNFHFLEVQITFPVTPCPQAKDHKTKKYVPDIIMGCIKEFGIISTNVTHCKKPQIICKEYHQQENQKIYQFIFPRPDRK